MKKLLLALFIFSLSLAKGRAQQDSCNLRITLLTCAPGAELYSTFGHTAIRVQDLNTGSDLVYNYGTFEFAPDFYSKFIRGKLLYSLSVESFPEFIYAYQMESRSVAEQELLIPCARKTALFAALQVNALEENRHYRYDFLFDNCTTRAKGIIEKNTGGKTSYEDIRGGQQPSFRNLIHRYLDRGDQPWSKLGIDFLLGAKLDREASNEETMFLPENLMAGMNTAKAAGVKIASREQTILQLASPLSPTGLTPILAFSILAILVIALSFLARTKRSRAWKVFDTVFFLLLGLGGLILLFMWFGTDHAVCANNWNLLWAVPLHLLGAFLVNGRSPLVRNYFLATALLNALFLLTWAFLPQDLNEGFIPLTVISLVRSWMIYKYKSYAGKEGTI